jgi:hypothetical protein
VIFQGSLLSTYVSLVTWILRWAKNGDSSFPNTQPFPLVTTARIQRAAMNLGAIKPLIEITQEAIRAGRGNMPKLVEVKEVFDDLSLVEAGLEVMMAKDIVAAVVKGKVKLDDKEVVEIFEKYPALKKRFEVFHDIEKGGVEKAMEFYREYTEKYGQKSVVELTKATNFGVMHEIWKDVE